MSLEMAHFAVGASSAFAVLNVLPQRIRRKVPEYGFVGILAGLWAMIPDLSKFTSRLTGLHDSVWANLFLFHQIMDRLDTRDSIWVVAGFTGLMLVLMAILWASEHWK